MLKAGGLISLPRFCGVMNPVVHPSFRPAKHATLFRRPLTVRHERRAKRLA
jgi:hypothetical protein